MKIKFRTSCAGNRFGFTAGKEYELEDDFALGFVKAGYAVPVVESRVEAAIAPDAERVAILPSLKKRKGK